MGNTSGRCKDEQVPSFQKAVAGLGDVRVAPLGAVVTSKVRITNDLSFDPTTVRGTKGGLNLDTVTEDIFRCLCGEPLPRLLAETLNSESVSKVDVSDAFRNVRLAQSMQTRSCYVRDDLIVAGLRLTFDWAGSPGVWGLSSAVKHAHRNTSACDAQIFSKVDVPCNHCRTVGRSSSESTSRNRVQTLR